MTILILIQLACVNTETLLIFPRQKVDFIIAFFNLNKGNITRIFYFYFLLLLNHTWYDWFGHFSYCEYGELFL